eukprot:CAMPEP_0172424660 /NCGR_PEP_ID=MMETSP1064-20121228/27110_1 /TAXON_ID=202472 /ORGANISM="Aulacoseira subarctica , Strain CCAP 1002/5" /LENGTH=153 /DNA_ID=CAMNT_0013166959 /DNA_START=148 /DNA_END=606 /DNA_ORIENTATION=-
MNDSKLAAKEAVIIALMQKHVRVQLPKHSVPPLVADKNLVFRRKKETVEADEEGNVEGTVGETESAVSVTGSSVADAQRGVQTRSRQRSSDGDDGSDGSMEDAQGYVVQTVGELFERIDQVLGNLLTDLTDLRDAMGMMGTLATTMLQAAGEA